MGPAETLQAVTNENGRFRFLSLPPSNEYVIRAELAGFKALLRENVVVSVGSEVELEMTMEMGALEEEVTVTAATPVVESKKTTVSQNVTQEVLQGLPTARDPWVILQMAPSMQMDRENIGGSESGQQSGFVAKGGDNAQSVFAMDGINITDPSAIGASPTYYDFDAFEEMNITIGSADVTVQTGGVALNLVTRRGGNKISLGGRFYYTDSYFQDNNFKDEYAEEGLVGTNRIRSIRDYGFNMGGPLIRDKAWWWMSYGVQNIQTTTVYGTPDDTLLQNYAGKINFQIIPENRLEIFGHIGNKQKWGRSASYSTPEGYNQFGKYHFGSPIFKVQDEHMFGENLFMSLTFSYADAGFNYVPGVDEDMQELSVWDITRGQYTGSYWGYRASRPVYQFKALANLFLDDVLGASHEWKAGFEWSDRTGQHFSDTPASARWQVNWDQPTLDITGDNIPDLVPGIALVEAWRVGKDHSKIGSWAAYLSDTATWGNLNVTLGFRYDHQAPRIEGFTYTSVDGDHPVYQTYYSAAARDAMSNVLPGLVLDSITPDYAWDVFSPRLGITYDIFGTGKTVAKLSFSQYGNFMGTGTADYFYPRGTGGWTDYWWLDNNSNGIVDVTELYWRTAGNYQPIQVFDEGGNIIAPVEQVEGVMWGGYDFDNPQQTSAPRYTLDDSAKSPRTSEVIFTLSHELLPDFGVAADVTYRRYDKFSWNLQWDGTNMSSIQSQNDYKQYGTIPTELGGMSTGESAGKPYYLFKEDIPYRWYRYRTARPDYYTDYMGLTIRANKRLSNRWMFNGSFTYQTQAVHYGDEGYLNPTNIWALEGQPYGEYMGGASGKVSQYVYSRWLVKLAGLYQLPWGINISGTVNAREGHVIRERFQIVDYSANPYNTSIWTYANQFGELRLPNFVNVSMRVEKVLQVADLGRIYVMFDLFNVFNSSIVNRRYQADHGSYFVQSDYFRPEPTDFRLNEILNPRVFRLGVRFQF
jgi:hypothetical protein